jgi:hypothetical protein
LFRGNAELAEGERAFAGVQHRLQIFQRRQVGPTPEQSDGNFFAPLITALDCLGEIGRVVPLFLQNLYSRIKPPTIAIGIGLIGFSTLPCGVLLVFIPFTLVGEHWPVVKP